MVHFIQELTPSPDRLVQVGLALFLLAAVLVVLAVGVFGMLVFAARGLFGSFWREPCVLREKVGQETFRS
jgi:hypothetical protein